MASRRRAALAAASTSLAAFALVGCTAAGGAPGSSTPAPSDDTSPESSTPETDDASSDGAGDSGYADGEYSAEGSYTSPGGEETITVTLTLEDGVVGDVTVDNPETTNPNSLRYQGEFIDGIAAEVVGVPLDEVSVDRVGGSSLTSGGFEDALGAIRDEAAA